MIRAMPLRSFLDSLTRSSDLQRSFFEAARHAMLRSMACWPSIVLGGIGIIWALFDREGQFLHDRIAGTRIARLPDSAPLNPPDERPRRQKK